MRNYFILLAALFSLSASAQSLDIEGETKHWEYNINGGLNTDGWQWDTGIAYYPIETIGFKLAFGFAGEIHELSDWDFGYYEDYYRDKETYAKIMASFVTYAVVSPDGEWFSKGDMGYWGCSSETADESLNWDLHYKERFIDTADPDWTLTIVDCHI